MSWITSLLIATLRAYIFSAVVLLMYGAIVVLVVVMFGTAFFKSLVDGGVLLFIVVFVGTTFANLIQQER